MPFLPSPASLLRVLCVWAALCAAPVAGRASEPSPIDVAFPRAIARWNAVPRQDLTGPFEVGVVAHHMNGIRYVLFSVNDTPVAAVEDESINPRTGSREYWFTLDPSEFDAPYVVTADVVPLGGQVRSLTGPDDLSAASKRGEHALVLNRARDGQPPVAYCSPTGSDENGNGTPEKPYRNPAFAAAKVNQHDDAGIIKLLPGEYTIGPKPYPRAISVDRWITFEPAEGVSRDQVYFTNYESGGISNDAHLVRFRNVSLVGPTVRYAGDRLWLDGCAVLGNRSMDYKVISDAWINKTYVTGCWVDQSRNGLRGAYLMRGVECGTISGSPFGASPHVVDCSVQRYDNSGTDGFHGDVFHWFPAGTQENIVIQDVVATNFDTQGIMAEKNYDEARVDNIAIVRVQIYKNPAPGSKAGSWWETPSNHLIIRDCVIPDQPFRWQLTNSGSVLSNVLITGNTFRNFSIDDISNLGFTNVVVKRNDFKNLTDYGAFSVGTPLTFGDKADLTTTNANPGHPGYGIADGVVDGADLSFYIELWRALDLEADRTHTNANPGGEGYGEPDGVVDGVDLSYFMEGWRTQGGEY